MLVPCAFIYSTCSGFTFPSSIASIIALAAPSPSSAGDVMWNASHVAPYPATSPYIFAPRFIACSYSSNTTTPAPSPITNPLLSLSNGIEALKGFSCVESAVSAENPPTPIGQTDASVPPASIISASPYWIYLNASPIECVPVAHAVTMFKHLPLQPNWIATFPAAIFVIIIGTNIGLILPGPFSSNFLCSLSIACKLPTPEPIETPILFLSVFSKSSPESSTACFAAATAYWENNSILLASRLSIYFVASKSLTSAASFTLKSVVSNFVISPIPTVPFFTFSQNVSMSLPIGDIIPNPVTTTLRFKFPYLHLLR